MLFRTKTVVTVLVCFAFLTGLQIPTGAVAADKTDKSDKNSDNNQMEFCSTLYSEGKKPGISDAWYESALNTCEKKLKDSVGGCSTAPEDFSKAVGELRTACSKAGIQSSGENGEQACGVTIARCTEPARTEEETPRSAEADENEVYNIAEAKKRYGHCPALAGADLKELREEMKKQREEIKGLKKEVLDASKESFNAKKELNQKLRDLKKQSAEDAKAHADKLNELNKGLRGQQAELAKEVTAIQTQIQQQEDALRQIQVSRQEAQNKYYDTKTQIELNCHKQALDEINGRINQTRVRESAGALNRGDFSTFMRNAGVSDRKAWQRMAETAYKRCMDSSLTKKSLESAAQSISLAESQISARETGIKRSIATLQTSQQQVQNSGPCGAGSVNPDGSTSGVSKMCAAFQQYKTDFAVENADYEQKKKTAEEDITAAQAEFREQEAINTQSSQAKSVELQAREKELKNLEDYLKVRINKAKGNSSTGDKVYEAFGKADALNDAARTLVRCEGRKNPASAAESYLIAIKEPVPEASSSTPASGTPASAGTGSGAAPEGKSKSPTNSESDDAINDKKTE